MIPSGVDTTFFAPTPVPMDPRVGFVGRLVDKKGIDMLMQAWPLVRAADPDATLRVLGEGPLARIVHGPGVELLAPDASAARRASARVIASSSVIATPSHTATDGDAESLLLVNLKRRRAAAPVVTTDHGGIPEFVDGTRARWSWPKPIRRRSPTPWCSVLSDGGLAARPWRPGTGGRGALRRAGNGARSSTTSTTSWLTGAATK